MYMLLCMKFLINLVILFLFFIKPGYGQDYKLGKINLDVTGDEVAQPYFIKGMLLLHNFEYSDAAQEFEMAQLLDPNFVMAYWGEACAIIIHCGFNRIMKRVKVLFLS